MRRDIYISESTVASLSVVCTRADNSVGILLLPSPEITAGRQPLEPLPQHPMMSSNAPAGLPPLPDFAIDGLARVPLALLGTRRCVECHGCHVHIGGKLGLLLPLCCRGTPAGADISALATVLAFSGFLS